MIIEFDLAKDLSNTTKHGVSLATAKALDWTLTLVWNDKRKDYGELREIALAPYQGRLYCAVFVDRGAVRRIISLRKANQREFDYYESTFDSSNE
jgi:uncharacterized DUF497 family protein